MFRLTIPTAIAISELTPMEVIPHILKWKKHLQLGKYPSAADGRNCNSLLCWVSTTDPNTEATTPQSQEPPQLRSQHPSFPLAILGFFTHGSVFQ